MSFADYLDGEGPPPYEYILDRVCQMFSCPPSVAEMQDAGVVRRIMMMRLYESAREQSERKAADMTQGQLGLFTLVKKWRQDA